MEDDLLVVDVQIPDQVIYLGIAISVAVIFIMLWLVFQDLLHRWHYRRRERWMNDREP